MSQGRISPLPALSRCSAAIVPDDHHLHFCLGCAAVVDLVVAGEIAQVDDPAFVQASLERPRFTPDRAVKRGRVMGPACSGNPVAPGWPGADQ